MCLVAQQNRYTPSETTSQILRTSFVQTKLGYGNSRIDHVYGSCGPTCRASRYGTKDRVTYGIEIVGSGLELVPVSAEAVRTLQSRLDGRCTVTSEFASKSCTSAIVGAFECDKR